MITPSPLAEKLALKVLDLWDAEAPSEFSPGNQLWPSWRFLSECMEALLRHGGICPLQFSKTVPSDVIVRVLHAAPRFKRNRNSLLLAVFGFVIRIFNPLKAPGKFNIRFPFKSDEFTVEFYHDSTHCFAKIFNQQIDSISITCLDNFMAGSMKNHTVARRNLNHPHGVFGLWGGKDNPMNKCVARV